MEQKKDFTTYFAAAEEKDGGEVKDTNTPQDPAQALHLFTEYLLPYKSNSYEAQNLELNKQTRLAHHQQLNLAAGKASAVPTSISSDKSQLENDNNKANYRGI